MSTNVNPIVLVVDDNQETERVTLQDWSDVLFLIVRHPNDVSGDDLTRSDVILIDYKIDNWAERSNGSIALQPLNGLALASVLKQQAKDKSQKPQAFVLRSAHLDELSGGFPPQPREHILAAAHDLEWVFPKGNNDRQNVAKKQTLSLARAVN